MYSEAGEMLRHYSTSRITVLSIVIPICLAILGFALAPGQTPAPVNQAATNQPAGTANQGAPSQTGGSINKLGLYLLVAEALLFLYALALSLFFSQKYEQCRQCLLRLEADE